MQQLLGVNGIATLHGQQHMQARKMITAPLSPKGVLVYIPRMVELAEKLCATWADAKHVKGFDSMKVYAFQVQSSSICT